MKGNVRRIISAATLLTSVTAIFLVLKKPQPVAQPRPVAAAAANAQSFQEKLLQLDRAKQPGEAPAEVHLSSDEVSAAMAQAAGAIPPAAVGGSSIAPASSPDVASTTGQPEVKDYQVNFDGDIARGQFLTQVAGKDVRFQRRLRHFRSHRIQGWRSQCSGLASQRCTAKKAHRTARSPETTRQCGQY